MRKRILALCLSLALLLCTVFYAEGAEMMVPELTNIYQFELPESEALDFVQNLRIGWNLGNTFDAHIDGYFANEMDMESCWTGVKTSEEVIDAVHKAGFNTLRLPVSWHNHVDKDFNISKPWLDRVQEVADWAIQRGMYVILNIHHDVYPEYMYPSEEHYLTAEKYVTTIWQQLAERFAAYDQHLIFESMNEPRLKGTDVEWWFDGKDPRALASAECINRLNQAFVNTVRAAGGENANRYLMVPGYCASPAFACADYFRLPEDTAEHKLIVSAHAYTPYAFTLDEKGTSKFNYAGAGDTREIATFMNDLYKKFVKNGIPVVIGEFGARDKGGNLQARVDFAAFYVASASARGIPCVWWDNHAFSGNGELFGIINRHNAQWVYPEIVEALQRYAGYDKMPPRPQQ